MLDPLDTLGPVWTPDPIVRSHPLNHGRVGWWLAVPGLDGGRQWFDLMGLYPGTLINMTTAASGWRGTTRPGGMGHVLFDGSDDYASCPGVSLAVGQEITIAFWSFVPTTAACSAFNFGNSTNTPNRCQAHAPYSDNIFYWDFGNTAGAGRISTSYSAQIGKWTRVVLQGGASWMAIFFNGKVAASAASSAPPTVTLTGLEIGRYSTIYQAGSLDDFAVWNRRLSAAEVAADYDLSRSGYPGVLRRWPGMGAALMAPPASGATLFYGFGGSSALLARSRPSPVWFE